MTIPRSEYPRPQLVRQQWQNLNGEWSYEFDFGNSGVSRELYKSEGFGETITVPFCPESELSGVGYRDFITSIWYQRTIVIPDDWHDKLVMLHFGAVDYQAEIYLDGTLAARHFGGSSSFSVDITRFFKQGGDGNTSSKEHNLVVHAIDDVRSGNQPSGKQSAEYHSAGCHYTRVTGIWQTVWMEAVHREGVKDLVITPDFDNKLVTLGITTHAYNQGSIINICILDDGNTAAIASQKLSPHTVVSIPLDSVRPWSPEDPFLYDLELSIIKNEEEIDHITSYFGMRKIHIDGNKVYLNNSQYYQRLVLDQGYYKKGIWTAPSDEDLKQDIELSLQAGFNGARLHQKAFEERFHYWADRLGYLTWAEAPSWGIDVISSAAARHFMTEWSELVQRDRNHPSIIAWTPLNETVDQRDMIQHRRLHEDVYALTKALDPSRPVNDASGYIHHCTDLWTVHQYEQDPAKFKEIFSPVNRGGLFRNFPQHEPPYEGQPYLVDEFGGIQWVETNEAQFSKQKSWGYGKAPTTIEDFYKRLEALIRVLDEYKHICGWCYTQLTDVEQEQNGIYNYDRSCKFDISRIKAIISGRNNIVAESQGRESHCRMGNNL